MKTSIYEIAEWLVERGRKFHVDLQKRCLRINGKYIIKNGEWNDKRPLHNFTEEQLFDHLHFLSGLYREYKHSRPTERSMSKGRTYFMALKERDLTDFDMMFGPVRDVAQLRLELAVLMLIIDGTFKWDDATMGTWFWQSQEIKDFVILKQWVMSQQDDNKQ